MTPDAGKFHRRLRDERTMQPCPLSARSRAPVRDARECVLERGGVVVRRVQTLARMRRASMLIQRMYQWRGYDTDIVAEMPGDAHGMTLEAATRSDLVATITLGFDSVNGLLADELYGPEIDAFRARRRKACELSRLAVDPEHGSKELLASLFQVAYIYLREIHDAVDAFIEVNPRHAGFYRRMLGFRQVGELRVCPRVDAPAVLLHLDLDYMREQIDLHAGSASSRARSLYPYFFPMNPQGIDAGAIAHAA